MISKSFIEDMKNKVSIVDLIDSYVPLKKQGKEFVACCPFHSESSPSFKVNEEKQIFHCFGCGENGGIIDFVMEHESISFSDAVETIAAKSGLTVERVYSRQPVQKKSNVEAKLTVIVKNVFSKRGESLTNKYDINSKTISELDLGAAINSQGLQQIINNDLNLKKTSALINFHSGYLKNPSDDMCLVVPLYKTNKQFAGLYVNSPKTPYHIGVKGDDRGLIYNPNKILERNKPIIILPSIIDTIKGYQVGIPNCVGVADTHKKSLTGEMLRSYKANEIYYIVEKDQVDTRQLALDLLASIKTSNNIIGLKVLITNDKINLPNTVAAYGIEVLPDILSKSNTWYDFIGRELTRSQDTNSEKFKAEMSKLLLDTFTQSTKHKDVPLLLHFVAEALGKCSVDINSIFHLASKSISEHVEEDLQRTENELMKKHVEYSNQIVAGIPIKKIDSLTALLILESKGVVEQTMTEDVCSELISVIGENTSLAKVVQLIEDNGYINAVDIKKALGEVEYFQVNNCLQEFMLDDWFLADTKLNISLITKNSNIVETTNLINLSPSI
ncbi:hypothetical protein HNW13_017605 [Shewanella sp. BF02_Schw]|uniref:CHC2 zinc finger domain-containing protein n=1 Tax=Shewanella sp. BF02_Schw TaxID=394908 RepID=UPI0017838917|nr:CHC2 zinc finger domain-containing protein [Shewanella sp. BF02_Schw]MBO1897556.1 hypothetical protein [Shewanella sp. BF02_Schw]